VVKVIKDLFGRVAYWPVHHPLPEVSAGYFLDKTDSKYIMGADTSDFLEVIRGSFQDTA
jgi:hypothetical protein